MVAFKALFGGSFNPPHWAHRQVIEYLLGLHRFDEVLVVPSFDHPFFKGLIPFSHRKKMCELMIEGLGPKVCVSSIEEELRLQPSYMINTVTALKKKQPDSQFTIVIGSDCQKELSCWKDIEKLKKEAQFLFIPRAGFEASPFMDITSSQIRQLIKEKKSYTSYVMPSIHEYIETNKLYHSSPV